MIYKFLPYFSSVLVIVIGTILGWFIFQLIKEKNIINNKSE